MRKAHLKLMIWALLLALASAGAWAAVSGGANLLAYFSRGAEPASALNIVPNVPPDLHVALAWVPDDADSGRAVDPLTRSQIESAYIRAWLQWNLSYQKGEPHGLATYFTGPALAAVGAAVQRAQADGLRIEQADTVHRLQLHLSSADGSVVAFTDHAASVAQVIRDSSGAVLSAGETRADYDVLLLLEDGLWRVRHWARRDVATGAGGPPQPPACPGCATVAGASVIVAGEPFRVAGVNYYPQATPWEKFWPQYDPAVIDRDMGRIKGLGLNTVRIFVPYDQFGGPHVAPAMIDRLGDLLDRARAQDLKVIVTLFDFHADYSLLHWPDADRQLEALLTRFATHPAILAWDLKNEPDLDDKRVGAQVMDAWLQHIAGQARSYDPNHLLTIGWSSSAAARRLAGAVDIVQFHYYAPAESFGAAYAVLRGAAPGRPLLLGEFGLPTWDGYFPNGHTEAEQAAYYAALLSQLRGLDSAGHMAWTLYDFADVPASVAGRWPWQTGPQRQMGLIRADSSEKPAAALLAPGADLTIPPAPIWARWLKRFW
ncbi:MAG: cellulase family glycosylhydrolase, partial [Chloroflexales bacterium]